MPIIFENRLGNSESDKKLRKIYRIHSTLWTFYNAVFIAGFGFGITTLAGVNGYPIFALIIALITIGVLVLFIRGQMYRKRRK